MKVLKGANLGARQHEINKKVNVVVKNSIDFNLVKDNAIESDVDLIYKIDIAAKVKNINYILEVLKGGDEFGIVRALNKCTWLGHDAFIKYINAEYVNHDLFPFMSIKIRKTFLIKISMCLKNEERLKGFYQLCCDDPVLLSIAPKFLRITSESYRIEQAKQLRMPVEGKQLKYFIGESFTLAQNYLNDLTQPSERNNVLFILRDMFSISDEQYLDLLETYYDLESESNGKQRFGAKISKNIIIKHKDRVYENPSVYMNVLNPRIVKKHGSYDEAELFANSVLPVDVASFWSSNYCETYGFILDLVKPDEKFSFVKKIFIEKYPNEEFEASDKFWESKLYNIMTVQEREDWALQRITNGQQLVEFGNEYTGYSLLTFDKAFEGIQKSIRENTDPDQRLPMILILVDCAKKPEDIENLFRFYFSEMSNETKQDTVSFLYTVIKQKNPLKFNENCWVAFEKLLWSMGAYDDINYQISNNDFIVLTLVYYIIKGKHVPDLLNVFLNMAVLNFSTVLDFQMDVEMQDKVYQYIYNYYLIEIKKIVATPSIDKKHSDLSKYLHSVLDLMLAFKKNKDDIPDFLNELMQKEWEKFKYHNLFAPNCKFDEGFIRRYLKSNATLVVNEFPKILSYIDCRLGNINWLLNKLRTYFSEDISKTFANKLKMCLCKEDLSQITATVAVRGIFVLGDETVKNELLEEFVSLDVIDTLPQRLLNIHRAICRQACYSRPPAPLRKVMGFIVGSTSYCFPMLYNLSINLPQPLFYAFVKLLCDMPPSIRKHGVVLAFKYLNIETLNIFTVEIWRKTTDPSLRATIYITLMKMFRNSTEKNKQRLFEALKYCTEDLKEDDSDKIFDEISVSNLPKHFRVHFLVAAWQAVSKFTEIPSNLKRVVYVIEQINEDICIIPEHILDDIISSHIKRMFNDKKILNNDNNFEEYHCRVLKAKWDLMARNFSYVVGEQRLSKNLELCKTILTECVEMWNDVRNETYVIREFFTAFINDVERYSYNHNAEDFYNINILFNAMISHLKTTLPDHETYILIWNLRLSVETKKMLFDEIPREKYESEEIERTLLIVKCLVKLAEAFGNLMIEYIASGKYFQSMYAEYENLVVDKIMILKNCLDKENYVDINLTDMIILLCTGLVQFEISEMYMFMLRILPTHYTDTYTDEYKSVLKTIKSFKSEEITYFLYEKFVNIGFSNFIDTF